MNLPDYFLADLPPGAELTAGLLRDACETLKRNRDQYLAARTTSAMVGLLVQVAQSWLRTDYPLRRCALDQGPSATGFSRATLSRGLDTFFSTLTPEGFKALLEQDLGHPDRLDRFCCTNAEQGSNRLAMATGPRFLVHIAAGNVPNPVLISMVLGLLLRSAQFVKCATGTALLPRLFAHSLYDADPKLGSCLEVAEWKGGNTLLEGVLFEAADCVTATGSDETLSSVRQRLPPTARFVGYGHKLSVAYVSAEALSASSWRNTLERAADDIVAWNQLGCLSPHVLYVQDGGTAGPENFAEALAAVLASREQSEPRGELPDKTAAAIASRRSIYELRAAHDPATRLWSSKGSTAWTVVYEADSPVQLSCLHRFIYVKLVKDLAAALQNADPFRGKVSTVGLAGADHELQSLATLLAAWGVPRVCPLGRMQNPPLAWRHDGRLSLEALATWTDWEQGR
jgi:hypothetical protein